jgi:hypothetical protein
MTMSKFIETRLTREREEELEPGMAARIISAKMQRDQHPQSSSFSLQHHFEERDDDEQQQGDCSRDDVETSFCRESSEANSRACEEDTFEKEEEEEEEQDADSSIVNCSDPLCLPQTKSDADTIAVPEFQKPMKISDRIAAYNSMLASSSSKSSSKSDYRSSVGSRSFKNNHDQGRDSCKKSLASKVTAMNSLLASSSSKSSSLASKETPINSLLGSSSKSSSQSDYWPSPASSSSIKDNDDQDRDSSKISLASNAASMNSLLVSSSSKSSSLASKSPPVNSLLGSSSKESSKSDYCSSSASSSSIKDNDDQDRDSCKTPLASNATSMNSLHGSSSKESSKSDYCSSSASSSSIKDNDDQDRDSCKTPLASNATSMNSLLGSSSKASSKSDYCSSSASSSSIKDNDDQDRDSCETSLASKATSMNSLLGSSSKASSKSDYCSSSASSSSIKDNDDQDRDSCKTPLASNATSMNSLLGSSSKSDDWSSSSSSINDDQDPDGCKKSLESLASLAMTLDEIKSTLDEIKLVKSHLHQDHQDHQEEWIMPVTSFTSTSSSNYTQHLVDDHDRIIAPTDRSQLLLAKTRVSLSRASSSSSKSQNDKVQVPSKPSNIGDARQRRIARLSSCSRPTVDDDDDEPPRFRLTRKQDTSLGSEAPIVPSVQSFEQMASVQLPFLGVVVVDEMDERIPTTTPKAHPPQGAFSRNTRVSYSAPTTNPTIAVQKFETALSDLEIQSHPSIETHPSMEDENHAIDTYPSMEDHIDSYPSMEDHIDPPFHHHTNDRTKPLCSGDEEQNEPRHVPEPRIQQISSMSSLPFQERWTAIKHRHFSQSRTREGPSNLLAIKDPDIVGPSSLLAIKDPDIVETSRSSRPTTIDGTIDVSSVQEIGSSRQAEDSGLKMDPEIVRETIATKTPETAHGIDHEQVQLRFNKVHQEPVRSEIQVEKRAWKSTAKKSGRDIDETVTPSESPVMSELLGRVPSNTQASIAADQEVADEFDMAVNDEEALVPRTNSEDKHEDITPLVEQQDLAEDSMPLGEHRVSGLDERRATVSVIIESTTSGALVDTSLVCVDDSLGVTSETRLLQNASIELGSLPSAASMEVESITTNWEPGDVDYSERRPRSYEESNNDKDFLVFSIHNSQEDYEPSIEVNKCFNHLIPDDEEESQSTTGSHLASLGDELSSESNQSASREERHQDIVENTTKYESKGIPETMEAKTPATTYFGVGGKNDNVGAEYNDEIEVRAEQVKDFIGGLERDKNDSSREEDADEFDIDRYLHDAEEADTFKTYLEVVAEECSADADSFESNDTDGGELENGGVRGSQEIEIAHGSLQDCKIEKHEVKVEDRMDHENKIELAAIGTDATDVFDCIDTKGSHESETNTLPNITPAKARAKAKANSPEEQSQSQSQSQSEDEGTVPDFAIADIYKKMDTFTAERQRNKSICSPANFLSWNRPGGITNSSNTPRAPTDESSIDRYSSAEDKDGHDDESCSIETGRTTDSRSIINERDRNSRVQVITGRGRYNATMAAITRQVLGEDGSYMVHNAMAAITRQVLGSESDNDQQSGVSSWDGSYLAHLRSGQDKLPPVPETDMEVSFDASNESNRSGDSQTGADDDLDPVMRSFALSLIANNSSESNLTSKPSDFSANSSTSRTTDNSSLSKDDDAWSESSSAPSKFIFGKDSNSMVSSFDHDSMSLLTHDNRTSRSRLLWTQKLCRCDLPDSFDEDDRVR